MPADPMQHMEDAFADIFHQVAQQNQLAAKSVLYEDELPEILTQEKESHA